MNFRSNLKQVLRDGRRNAFTILASAALMLSGCSSSNQTETTSYQCYYDYVNSKAALPEFDGRLFWSPDSAGARLDVYVSVRESRLKYGRENNSFIASYSCVVLLSGNGGAPISKEIDRNVILASYPEADQNSFDAFLVSFPIKSGEHNVQISVTDNGSRQKASRFYTINVPDVVDKPLVLSDIMLLARYDSLVQGRKITPFILSNVGLLPDTLKFFTVLSSKKSSEDSLFIFAYRIINKEPNVPTFNVQMSAYQPMAYNPCGNDVDTVLVYRHSTAIDSKEGLSFVFGSLPKPPPGNFLLKVSATNNLGDSATTSLKFQVHDKDFPKISDNLHDMVNSLNYIAAGVEIKKILSEKTDSSVKANLITFWKDHGGLAKMVQYYQRVSLANQLFTSCLEGWKTPMGMYLIVCGSPDYVECVGEWDERWSYYQSSSQNSMTVIFRLAQETPNIGDRFYRIEQVYSTVDLWDYYVNQWRTPY